MGKIYGEKYPKSVISLAKYAKIISYSECAFFGVQDSRTQNYNCRTVWEKWQRDNIAFHLAEAQSEIENLINIPLAPRWFKEETRYACPVVTRWGELIESGIERVTDLELGALVDHTDDPAEIIITPADPILPENFGNIHVYYPGEDQEITIADIEASGVDIIITIPRCRLVAFDLLDNPPQGHIYDEMDNFQETVDVKYIDNDPATQAVFIYPNACNHRCGTSYCSHNTQTACEYILDKEVGIMTVNAANYDEETGRWIYPSNGSCYSRPTLMELNYRAGFLDLPLIAQMAIVRLAHSKMPEEPCGCDVSQKMWRRDRRIPDVLTKERLECPFGISDGAWISYTFANSIALVKGDVV
jgi:hypothetical protein